MKPPHKFFERFLDNDLDGLYSFLLDRDQDIRHGKLPNIPLEKAADAAKTGCMATSLSLNYNIFQFHDESIYKLYEAIKSMTQEACEYYGIDFKSQKYMVQGWFNCDENGDGNINDLHDHSPDSGAPYYHGYYCVNAEPSITNYKVNRETMFDNINKNNRAILSETGHPHRKGAWNSEKKRITIAYDMMPLKDLAKTNVEQHWVPLI